MSAAIESLSHVTFVVDLSRMLSTFYDCTIKTGFGGSKREENIVKRVMMTQLGGGQIEKDVSASRVEGGFAKSIFV